MLPERSNVFVRCCTAGKGWAAISERPASVQEPSRTLQQASRIHLHWSPDWVCKEDPPPFPLPTGRAHHGGRPEATIQPRGRSLQPHACVRGNSDRSLLWMWAQGRGGGGGAGGCLWRQTPGCSPGQPCVRWQSRECQVSHIWSATVSTRKHALMQTRPQTSCILHSVRTDQECFWREGVLVCDHTCCPQTNTWRLVQQCPQDSLPTDKHLASRAAMPTGFILGSTDSC